MTLRSRRVGLLLALLLVVAPAAPAAAQHAGDGDQHAGTGDEHSGGESDQGETDSPTTTAAPTTTEVQPDVSEPDVSEPDVSEPDVSEPDTTEPDQVGEQGDERDPTTTTAAPTTVPEDPQTGSLPLTGGDVRALAAIGLAVAVAGAALVLVGRRRDDAAEV